MSETSPGYRTLLKQYLLPQRGRVALLAFLVLFSIGLQLTNPQIIRIFLDQLQTGGTLEQLLGAASLFMGVTVFTQFVRLAATYFSEVVGWTATNWLRADIARHCLNLDLSFHKSHTPGELIERVDGDVNLLANFFSEMILLLIGNGLLFLGIVVLLWFESWQLGVMIGLVALVSVVVVNALRRRITPRWEALRAAEAMLFGFLEERLNGTEDIQTSGAKAYTMGRLHKLLHQRWRAALSALHLDTWVLSMPVWIFGLAYAGAHLVSGNLFLNGALTIGTVYLVFYYIGMVESPLWQTMDMVDKFQQAVAAINRINRLFSVKSALVEGPGLALPPGPLGVRFEDVSFFYDDEDLIQKMEAVTDETSPLESPEETSLDEIVIDGVSFELAPGSVLGLLGRTGSGKSTLSKLLFRFYDPTEGRIELTQNGSSFDLRQARRGDLSGRVGLVTQDVQLFHASVRDNLTLFDDSIEVDQINSVLKEIGMDGWVDELPDGLDTFLSGARSGLSAGEAQLLAFARLFLADPGLVILDEASSRLDPATEQRIEMALNRLLQDRTAIIIAHRLATVQRADTILILERGAIAEFGERMHLAADPNSRFSGLLRTGLEEALA